MFDLEQSISKWGQEMRAAGITRPEILNELEGHLREEIQRLTSSGMAETKAFHNAVRELGNGKLLKQEFKKAGQRPSFRMA